MRIIHWYSGFLSGGAVSETVLGLANAQRRLGHDVLVASRVFPHSPVYNSGLRADLQAELYTWESGKTLMIGKLPATLVPGDSIAKLRKYQADILHLHGDKVYLDHFYKGYGTAHWANLV